MNSKSRLDADLLIANVFQRRPLWDKKDKRYSKRIITDRLWSEIAFDMGIEERMLRKKWKYLRDNFVTEYNKEPSGKSGDATDTGCHSKWAFYQQLLFLKDVITPKASSGSLQSLLTAQEAESMLEDDVSSTYYSSPSETYPQGPMAVDLAHSIQKESSDVEGNENLEDYEEPFTTTGPFYRMPSISRPRKRKSDDYFYEQLLAIEQQKLEYYSHLKEAKKTDEDEEEDLLFFKSLIPHAKKIPPHMKLSFRNRLQEVVEEFAYPPNRVNDETLRSPSTTPEGPSQ